MYDKALDWHGRALAGRQRTLGEDHPDTLTLISEIASTYSSQGKWDKALEWHGRALAGRERTLGTDHQDTRMLITEMAATHRMYVIWRGGYKRAHGTQEMLSGKDSPIPHEIAKRMVAASGTQGTGDEALNQVERGPLSSEELGKMHIDTCRAGPAASGIQGANKLVLAGLHGKQSKSESGIGARLRARLQDILRLGKQER